MIKPVVDFFGDAQYARLRRRLFYLVLVLIVAGDFLVPRDHAEYLWERLPGWPAAYGFGSCVLLIFVFQVSRPSRRADAARGLL